LKLSRY